MDQAIAIRWLNAASLSPAATRGTLGRGPNCVYQTGLHAILLETASRAATRLAAFAARIVRGALPPVLFEAFCLVFGIPTIAIVTYDLLECNRG